jgi:hypothetical protein
MRIKLSLSVAVAVVSLTCFSSAAPAQTSKTQSISLPDPTPREIDPHLLYGGDSAAQSRAQQTIEARNAKRRELIQWAANQLVLLSQRLQTDVAASRPGEPLTPAAANAERIEKIAASVKAAVKAP